jgi:DNA-binding XRE family transcriptional regulator
MTKQEFSRVRKALGKTQRELAELLGSSLKAVHSYEQGWRNIPVHVERQLLFMMTQRRGEPMISKACWTLKKCPTERKRRCPAWEFNAGKLCWFVNGTLCEGTIHKSWREKMKVCRSCEMLEPLKGILGEVAATD